MKQAKEQGISEPTVRRELAKERRKSSPRPPAPRKKGMTLAEREAAKQERVAKRKEERVNGAATAAGLKQIAHGLDAARQHHVFTTVADVPKSEWDNEVRRFQEALKAEYGAPR